MDNRPYYMAYDDRYRQVHDHNLQWFSSEASPIVREIMDAFLIAESHQILEIGCGEGRDAFPLLKAGFDLTASDVSAEAVGYCRKMFPEYADHFQVLDCLTEKLDRQFDFIFAVAVIHMLVPDRDREAFYAFVRQHLNPWGTALICTMGDGVSERRSDISAAFEMQERVHEQSGRDLRVAGTSCRIVSFDTFAAELQQSGLEIVRQGMTEVPPDFPQMMYAVVRRPEQNV